MPTALCADSPDGCANEPSATTFRPGNAVLGPRTPSTCTDEVIGRHDGGGTAAILDVMRGDAL
ncbi:hypothetical protein AB0G02_28925 [Actinosynnema sp. NPDC023658]|uniref:hypothetical protein n=1 Tax=Actinosynnema sp. NPDC023658 TaxID=3155465 RepID=UPI0033E7D1BC